MRFAPFVIELQDQFGLLTNHALAETIAVAMHHADMHGLATFSHDGEMYTIAAMFEHGCINYDCNPATCWMEYEIRAWNS